jgi:hypothetical protein
LEWLANQFEYGPPTMKMNASFRIVGPVFRSDPFQHAESPGCATGQYSPVSSAVKGRVLTVEGAGDADGEALGFDVLLAVVP